jgi:hypothetical protein
LFAFLVSKAQEAPKTTGITFGSDDSYVQYEPLVLECADFILQSNYEMNSSKKDNLNAFIFIINWMSGTPDYSYTIDSKITKICKNQSLLSSVYMAACVKYSLENKKDSKNPQEISYNGYLTFIKYCENPDNGVIIKGEMKKLIDAKNNNKLKKYLKME